MATCPICEVTLRSEPVSRGPLNDVVSYDCHFCGKFGLTGTAAETVPPSLQAEPKMRPIFSHILRKMQHAEEWPVIGTSIAAKIFETAALPTPKEQADNLIRWLGDNVDGPGDRVNLSALISLRSIIGAISDRGVHFIIDGLLETELLVKKERPSNVDHELTLSFAGWERYEELRRGRPTGRKAFMAMKFDDSLRRIVDEHFRPAVQQTGFTLGLLDDEPRAGLIDDRLRVEIQAARFIVSDLTHDNSGAYWEAGYAEGLRKPVIYTCRRDVFEEHGTHFDTNHLLTVLWSEDSLVEAMEMLKATIRATIPEAQKVDD